MAIMLKEEGLLHKSVIYATDINQDAILKAREGIFQMNSLQNYTQNYIRSGGKASFSDYYIAKYDGALIAKELKENIVFSVHPLSNLMYFINPIKHQISVSDDGGIYPLSYFFNVDRLGKIHV
jgi:chemotaxis methyl-accepting protein methylase